MILRLALFSLWPMVVFAQAVSLPELNDVLRGVAENQGKALTARLSIVYTQEVRTRSFRGGGKLAREEKRRYTVIPTATSTEKKLDFFEGHYEKGGKLFPYTDPRFRKDVDSDGSLVESMTDALVNDKQSRDGISTFLFPLTAEEQTHYSYRLVGTQKVNGVDAIRLLFEPKQGDEGRCWSGEALVDPVELQPVRVVTKLARNIPLAVKVLLGTNVRQLGFTVTYRNVAKGLWFPVSYGTEFHLRAAFLYARTITMSLDNRDFRQASAESSFQFKTKPLP